MKFYFKMNVVHPPTSGSLFISTQMNTVNIRIVPINRAHRGGLVIMREIKHDREKRERDWQNTGRGQRRQRRGRQRGTPTQTKSRRESKEVE